MNNNNITFTGLRNMGGMGERISTITPDAIASVRRSMLLVNLTDDFRGKDLTEFNNVLKKCNIKDGKFFWDNNFVHIITAAIDNGKDIPDLLVNWQHITPSHETMPLFSYIAKLTRRISGMKDSEFIINNDFKHGEAGDMYMVPRKMISKLSDDPIIIQKILDCTYSPEAARTMANEINEDIQTKMYRYLDIRI